ncbi:MAG: hypothetical protein QT11_C0001G0485 [archaeon GW2011_AR20]|nr:MAG: hypothetical protein QT11_C0001G0485 [archaeon GW2011_AR20]AQS28156.1 hypothetical protein [uncultured archaeon]MBS3160548.1 hypothetical protein [Candidatus Woesearchaeota archaeon]
MEQEKKLNILIYVLIAVTIALIIFAVINFKKPILSNKYVYTSPSGEQFQFFKSEIGNITQHIVTIYAIDKQNNKHQVDIPIISDPYSIEDIPILNEVKTKILDKDGVYITLDPYGSSKSVLAAIEINRVLGTNDYGVFKIPTQSATYKPTNTTFPYITCTDATKQIGVIYLLVENKTRIASLGECVVVEGKDYDDLIKAADKLTLHLLGVM